MPTKSSCGHARQRVSVPRRPETPQGAEARAPAKRTSGTGAKLATRACCVSLLRGDCGSLMPCSARGASALLVRRVSSGPGRHTWISAVGSGPGGAVSAAAAAPASAGPPPPPRGWGGEEGGRGCLCQRPPCCVFHRARARGAASPAARVRRQAASRGAESSAPARAPRGRYSTGARGGCPVASRERSPQPEEARPSARGRECCCSCAAAARRPGSARGCAVVHRCCRGAQPEPLRRKGSRARLRAQPCGVATSDAARAAHLVVPCHGVRAAHGDLRT